MALTLDTRLVALTSASGTLGDLPTQGLSGWPGQLLPYPESSPGGDHSLAPPSITMVPRAGLVSHVG